MDFRYIIILIVGLFFHTFIGQLVADVPSEWFVLVVILSYGTVAFFTFPMMFEEY